jgi:hypothetical protein
MPRVVRASALSAAPAAAEAVTSWRARSYGAGVRTALLADAGGHLPIHRRAGSLSSIRFIAGIVVVLAFLLPSSAAAQDADRDCADFSSQAAAQEFLSRGGPSSDPDRLDGDGDGIACGSLPCPCTGGGPPPPPAPPPRPPAGGRVAPCGPSDPVGLHFPGLPGSLVFGKRARFGVDDRIEASVFGTVHVQMIDENGRVFADVQLVPVIDEAWVMLELGNRFVQIVATAQGNHLDGTRCFRTISQTVAALNRISFPSRCSNLRYRPASVIVACGDGNFELRRLRWHGWGSAVSRRRGVALVNDCVPYCAQGRFHRLPANVKLYARRRCDNVERYVYTKLRYRIRGRLPELARAQDWAVPFPCRIYDD